MSLGGSLKLVAAGVAWRSLGNAGAGRTLLEATSSDDEQERMLAGISLVKAGEQSIDLIGDAAETGYLSPEAVRLLADIGGPRSRVLLTEISSEPGELGEAATSSLELLDRIEALPPED